MSGKIYRTKLWKDPAGVWHYDVEARVELNAQDLSDARHALYFGSTLTSPSGTRMGYRAEQRARKKIVKIVRRACKDFEQIGLERKAKEAAEIVEYGCPNDLRDALSFRRAEKEVSQ